MNMRNLFLSTSIGFLSLLIIGFFNWKRIEATPISKKSGCQPIENILTVFEEFEKPAVSEPDFFYDFGTRFNPITKGHLDQARTFADFLSEDDANWVETYENSTVIIIENDIQTDKRATTKGGKLNKEQLAMLQSADYSTNLLIEVEYIKKKNGAIQKYLDTMTPYFSVVPEKQAAYEFGREGLLSYLKDYNRENTKNLDETKLQPAKLYFTITKDGDISDVKLDRTSGYDHIDKTMIKLMSNTPGRWIQAENADGEKVDQTLVVYFGLEGC